MKFYRDVVSRTLANGVRLFVLPQPGSAVEVECFIKTGSIHEGEFLGCGLSHFLEHMLFQGCEGYPGTAAADFIDRLGGSMNAYTSYDHTAYHAHLAGRHLPEAVQILSAMIRTPEFPEERFAAERKVILRERELGRDNPDRRLYEEMTREIFKVNPLRHPIIGYRELIADVTREMMMSYYARRYTPQRCFWVIVGDVDPEQACGWIEKEMGDWKISHVAEAVLPQEPEQTALRRSEFEFADPLARLAVGFRVPAVTHRDIPALEVLAGILGMGDGSRLVRILELEKKLAIQLRSFCYAQPVGGMFGIAAGTSPDRLDRLERALRKELAVIRKGGISRAEVEREKTQQFADHLRELGGIREIAANVGGGVIADNAPAMSDSYLQNLKSLTHDDVVRVAEEYLKEEHFSVVRQLSQNFRRAASAKRPVKRQLTPVLQTLSCGAGAVALADRRLPLIHFCMVLPGGTIFEPAAWGGISGLTADLLTAGSKKRSESAILQALDAGGAELNFAAGANSLILEVSAPRRHFAKVMGVLGELLSFPAFGEAEFEREKENRRELLKSRMQSPRAAATDHARKLLFGKHPYSWGNSGTLAQLENITRDDVASFFASRWNPAQVFFGFGGDCDEAEAWKWAEELSSGIAWRKEALLLPEEPEFPQGRANFSLELPREQTAVVTAIPGIAVTEREFFAFEILNHAENGLSSRLFKDIREKNAMAYSAGMQLMTGMHRGMLLFHTATTAEQAEAAAGLLQSEIARLCESGLDVGEFEAAREGAAFSAARQCETVSGALVSTLLALHYRQDLETPWHHEEKIRSMSRDGVNAILRSSFKQPPCVTGFAGRLAQKISGE